MTESGEVLDGCFGAKSIDDRIVNSFLIMGTTNTLVRLIKKKAIEAYRGK